MGLIKEPKGVDFIINSKPLTKEEEEKLSEFIAKRKREIAKVKKRERPTKTKTKPKSKQKT